MSGFGAQGAEVRNMWMGGYLTKGNPLSFLGPEEAGRALPLRFQRTVQSECRTYGAQHGRGRIPSPSGLG